MAVSDTVQTLTAAFSFGIVLQAALGALFIFSRSNEGTLFADGRRLVLIFFVIFAALWAQIDFLNLMITSGSSSLCQVSLVFSTMADQLARVSAEQFLMWSVGHGTKVTIERMALQGVLVLRLFAGGVLGGFTRPDFAPVCVAQTTLLPVSIGVVSVDFLIIGVLLMRAAALGVFRDMRQEKSEALRIQSMGLIMSIFGLAAWTATSVPMILGIPSILILLRTLLPAAGLLILIVVVVIYSGTLILPIDSEEVTTPEARSPFVAPATSIREIVSQDIGNGSPMPGLNPSFTRNGSLFVTNPSSTPRDSPKSFQGNQFGTSRGFTKLAEETPRDIRASERSRPEARTGPEGWGPGRYIPSRPARLTPSVLAPLTPFSTIAPSATGVTANTPPVLPASVETPKGQVFVFSPSKQQARDKTSIFSRGKSQGKHATVQGLVISHPHMTSSAALVGQLIPKINTIDLTTAAINERERREGAATRARLVANRPPPQPPSIPIQQAAARMSSVRRKEISKPVQNPTPILPSSSASALSAEGVNGSTTSASLSPGREDLRRRSPRAASAAEKDSALKSSLARKTILGLPSNPRSRTNVFSVAPAAQEQTVMLLNDVTYDNPAVVRTIIKEASEVHAASRSKEKETSSPVSYTTEVKTNGSVLHRPRPMKKESEQERAIFPAEPSPSRKRSKSHSSVISRKSIFNMPQGSPTALPPLPPPPKTATRIGRILPNDTKSMTFHEKVELLFPDTPGTTISDRRRSSVPSIPFRRSLLDPESPTEREAADRNRDSSQRASTYFFGDMDTTSPRPEPKQVMRKNENRQSYWFSKNTRQSVADQVGDTWIPGIAPQKSIAPSQSKENSLPASPEARSVRKSAATMATSHNDGDDSTSFWGSLHSEVPPIDISKAMLTARETIIQRKAQIPVESVKPQPPPKDKSVEDDQNVVMDEEDSRSMLESFDRKQSFFFDDDSTSAHNSTQNIISWHRRIGDELPSFSERKSMAPVRKMPPPAPLLLGKYGRQATVVIRNPEPSPLESPEHAINELQEQLEKLDETNRGSVGALLRRMPDAESDPRGNPGGLSLLENLEKEMGLQESVWQQMQTNMDRDSMSVTMSPQRTEPESTISREPSQRSTQRPSRSVSRRARIRSSMTVRSKADDSGSTPSTESSDNSRASAWQKRLAGAQIEYMENAPALIQNPNLNFLTLSNSQFQNITPPGSDHSADSGTDIETEFESESESAEMERLHSFKSKKASLLWQQVVPAFKPATRALWIQPSTTIRRSSLEPAAKDLRPAPRFAKGTLAITSILLWTKPRASPKNRAGSLWTSKKSRPKSIVTRPVTQRPQRRSRRQTFLPDIVESPVPVPNKRDTLGIFQFPWGELSDQPIYQPAFDLSILARPLLSAKLEARSRELEPEISEYESSFFDDYDEDNSEDEDEEDASDDDFDETTLWEIASLLKSNDVPSRESMFPGQDSIEDYDESEESEIESQPRYNTMRIDPRIAPLGTTAKNAPQLWSGSVASNKVPATVGLAQPAQHIWSALVISATPGVGQIQRPHTNLPVLTTHGLWTAAPFSKVAKSTSGMWSAKGAPQSMWTPAPKATETAVFGLFSVSAHRTEYRITSSPPAAINMIRKPRAIQTLLSQLTSNELWSAPEAQFSEHHWVSESSVRPESPSIYSASSSGRSTPDSDASSAISMSSKASSIWSAVGTAAWWEQQQSTNRAAGNDSKGPTTPIKNAPHPSKIASRSQGTPLPAVRESRILAFQDLWENGVPKLAATPVKKTGRSVALETITSADKLLRQQYRPTFAYPGGWEAALAEAIVAGSPEKMLVRPSASPADWDMDLAKAVSLSQPRLQRPASSPTSWANALAEALASSQASKAFAVAQIFDSAVLHPVFFTSSLHTTADDIHPAAFGYVLKPNIGMWEPASSVAASSGKGPMWRKSAAFDRAMPTQAELLDGHLRTAPSTKGIKLSKLESKAMWNSIKSSATQQNWLVSSTKNAAVGMWTAPTSAPKNFEAGHLWSANTGTHGRFANPHTEPWKQTKRANLKLTELETRSLWRPSMELPPSPKNWLKKKEVRGVVFRY